MRKILLFLLLASSLSAQTKDLDLAAFTAKLRAWEPTVSKTLTTADEKDRAIYMATPFSKRPLEMAHVNRSQAKIALRAYYYSNFYPTAKKLKDSYASDKKQLVNGIDETIRMDSAQDIEYVANYFDKLK